MQGNTKMSPPTLDQVIAYLALQSLPVLCSSFIKLILNGSAQQQPLPAIAATIKHRLLSSDISSSSPPILSPTSPYLPTEIIDKHVKSAALPHDVFVQIIDIQDTGRSRWDQIESLEAELRGEKMRGREIIRTLPSIEQEPSLTSPSDSTSKLEKGPFKLILQDCKGIKIWAFELSKIEKIGFPPAINIGCKIWLKKGCKIGRGMLLLEPATVVVIGGKMEAKDKAWKEGRSKRLKDFINGVSDAIS